MMAAAPRFLSDHVTSGDSKWRHQSGDVLQETPKMKIKRGCVFGIFEKPKT
jgi:hypothetical protein